MLKYLVITQVAFIAGIICQPHVQEYFTKQPHQYDQQAFNRLAETVTPIDLLEEQYASK